MNRTGNSETTSPNLSMRPPGSVPVQRGADGSPHHGRLRVPCLGSGRGLVHGPLLHAAHSWLHGIHVPHAEGHVQRGRTPSDQAYPLTWSRSLCSMLCFSFAWGKQEVVSGLTGVRRVFIGIRHVVSRRLCGHGNVAARNRNCKSLSLSGGFICCMRYWNGGSSLSVLLE